MKMLLLLGWKDAWMHVTAAGSLLFSSLTPFFAHVFMPHIPRRWGAMMLVLHFLRVLLRSFS
jgi:hypothetical protein